MKPRYISKHSTELHYDTYTQYSIIRLVYVKDSVFFKDWIALQQQCLIKQLLNGYELYSTKVT